MEAARLRGRPRKLGEIVEKDCQARELNKKDAIDRFYNQWHPSCSMEEVDKG